MTVPGKITCLAVGNTIMGDDGIGQALLELVQDRGPAGVDYVDGAIAGLELLGEFQDAERLLVLDAVAGPGVPGEAVRLEGADIRRFIPQNVSPHQVGLMDLFGAARLLNDEPDELVVVGVVAEKIELEVGLTGTARSGLEAAARLALEQLAAWTSGPDGADVEAAGPDAADGAAVGGRAQPAEPAPPAASEPPSPPSPSDTSTQSSVNSRP